MKKAVEKERRTLTGSFKKALHGISTSIPMIVGVILLIGLFKTFITNDILTSVFSGYLVTDTVIGALIGSISAGNPITSYIIGGEILKQGVSLFAVTAFLVAWVTVGLVQLPAEAGILGKRFAITRNLLSLVLSMIVAVIVVLALKVIA